MFDRLGPSPHGACDPGSKPCPHLIWPTLGTPAGSQQGMHPLALPDSVSGRNESEQAEETGQVAVASGCLDVTSLGDP